MLRSFYVIYKSHVNRRYADNCRAGFPLSYATLINETGKRVKLALKTHKQVRHRLIKALLKDTLIYYLSHLNFRNYIKSYKINNEIL
jgi:hypothetical protein